MILAYFERKDYVQQNLYLNCVSLWKGFEGLSLLYGSFEVLVIWGDTGQSVSGV